MISAKDSYKISKKSLWNNSKKICKNCKIRSWTLAVYHNTNTSATGNKTETVWLDNNHTLTTYTRIRWIWYSYRHQKNRWKSQWILTGCSWTNLTWFITPHSKSKKSDWLNKKRKRRASSSISMQAQQKLLILTNLVKYFNSLKLLKNSFRTRVISIKSSNCKMILKTSSNLGKITRKPIKSQSMENG